MAQGEKRFKVVLLGEGSQRVRKFRVWRRNRLQASRLGCVGKTSLFLRFTKNEFNEEHETTLQASYQNKRINLPDGRRANLALWVRIFPAFTIKFRFLKIVFIHFWNKRLLSYRCKEFFSFFRAVKVLLRVRCRRFLFVHFAHMVSTYLCYVTYFYFPRVSFWMR